MEWITLALGILGGGALGVVLAPYASAFTEWTRGRGGSLSGTWHQTLPATAGFHKSYERTDVLVVHHNRSSGLVTATCKRIFPEGEAGKTWRLRGYIKGGDVFLLYWPDGKLSDPESYGFIILRPTASPYRWVGKYWRPATNTKGGWNDALRKMDIQWTREGHGQIEAPVKKTLKGPGAQGA